MEGDETRPPTPLDAVHSQQVLQQQQITQLVEVVQAQATRMDQLEVNLRAFLASAVPQVSVPQGTTT